MGVKGIWESTSIAITLGDILFIYWVFSFDLIKIRQLANERINKDDINIEKNNEDIKDENLINNDNYQIIEDSNNEGKTKEKKIEMINII